MQKGDGRLGSHLLGAESIKKRGELKNNSIIGVSYAIVNLYRKYLFDSVVKSVII